MNGNGTEEVIHPGHVPRLGSLCGLNWPRTQSGPALFPGNIGILGRTQADLCICELSTPLSRSISLHPRPKTSRVHFSTLYIYRHRERGIYVPTCPQGQHPAARADQEALFEPVLATEW